MESNGKIGFFGGKFLPFHMGHLNTILKAHGLCDRLYIGISFSDKRDKQLCSNMKYVPIEVRIEWLNRLVKDFNNVTIFSFKDNDGINYNSWKQGSEKVKNFIKEPIDFVFGSEIEYSTVFKTHYPNSQYILIDPNREVYDISSSRIRKEGVFKSWEFLPKIVREFFIKKVCIVGTESCGKSILAKKLALYYNTGCVEEFGRKICEDINGIPLECRYLYIAAGQLVSEYEKIKSANKVIFIDTDAITTNYYLNLYTSHRNDNLYESISNEQNHDLYLYLTPDVEWIDDGLRLHGKKDQRVKNDKMLRSMYDRLNIKHVVLYGSYDSKLNKSIDLVNALLRGEI